MSTHPALKPIAAMAAAEYAALTGADLDYREAVAAHERAVKRDGECPSESTVHEVNFAHEEMMAAERDASESHAAPLVMRNAHRMR